MGCKVLWTPSARRDVERAVRYIAKNLDSPKAAAELLDSLESAADDISTFPEACPLGRNEALASRGLRKKVVGRYVMLYSFDGETAIVARVFHFLQDYARIIDG